VQFFEAFHIYCLRNQNPNSIIIRVSYLLLTQHIFSSLIFEFHIYCLRNFIIFLLNKVSYLLLTQRLRVLFYFQVSYLLLTQLEKNSLFVKFHIYCLRNLLKLYLESCFIFIAYATNQEEFNKIYSFIFIA